MSTAKESLRDLNKSMEALRKILRLNWAKSRVENLTPSDQEDLYRYEETLDEFLWKVCLHETHHIELAAAAVTETRLDFLNLLQKADNGEFFERVKGKVTILLLPANAWLYLHARIRMKELKQAAGPLMGSIRHDRLGPPKEIRRDPIATRAALAAKHCVRLEMDPPALRPPQNVQRSSGGPGWEPCGRSCDLFLLVEIGFRWREMKLVVGRIKSTAHDQLTECERREGLLKEIALQSATNSRPAASAKL